MRLFLLRHAKSDWARGVDDHERPLSARGRRAASAVGAWLRGHRDPPTLVLCSSSARTVETAERLFEGWTAPPAIEVRDELYLAGARELLAYVQRVDAATRSLMTVAHNPGTAELALRLAGRGDEAARRRLASKYPTCALAELLFEDARGWSGVVEGAGELRRFLRPRELE